MTCKTRGARDTPKVGCVVSKKFNYSGENNFNNFESGSEISLIIPFDFIVDARICLQLLDPLLQFLICWFPGHQRPPNEHKKSPCVPVSVIPSMSLNKSPKGFLPGFGYTSTIFRSPKMFIHHRPSVFNESLLVLVNKKD